MKESRSNSGLLNQLLKTWVIGIKICQELIYIHTQIISCYVITPQFSTAFVLFNVWSV